ncbi:MAG: YolD-like family protein [Firmicutes bacterium]|nr:YolD-like family protein [Bacillota bacterium]
MQNRVDRAKQFLPFDALSGFRDYLNNAEKIKQEKKVLSDDIENYINNELSKLKKGDSVIIKYYYGIEYLEISGVIKKIDNVEKCIFLLNSKIDFEDILDIRKN